MAAMTSSNLNFQKSKKTTQVNICQIICAKFHQNRRNRLGCRASTQRHTHTHTHTHSFRHSVSIATYSVKMTEYENGLKNDTKLRHFGVFLQPTKKIFRIVKASFLYSFLDDVNTQI